MSDIDWNAFSDLLKDPPTLVKANLKDVLAITRPALAWLARAMAIGLGATENDARGVRDKFARSFEAITDEKGMPERSCTVQRPTPP
jgi:hypothetical protein